MKNILITYCLFISVFGQCAELYGKVVSLSTKEAIPYAKVTLTQVDSETSHYSIADDFGRFYFGDLQVGAYLLETSCLYHKVMSREIRIENGKNDLILELEDTNHLAKVDVFSAELFNSRNMRMIEGLTITTGKKTQYIDIQKIDANRSTNNARELYAKVPGLNIWESDGGGLQLGIGTRGLSPSRTAHFNTRQNGYDISADPLGYPETYYTPPAEAIQGIQLIRGAASLQFGPQFGGMLNFKLIDPSDKAISYRGAHTYGAYNLFNTFNTVSGTLKKRFSYLFYHQYKQGDGWRENSGFKQQQAFGQLTYHFTDRLYFSIEHTYMTYLSQQAGGLTDQLFNQDPRQSIRERNWFKVDWNVTALNLGWRLSSKTTLDLKAFKVYADRLALGNLEKISRIDDLEERDLIVGDFDNFGSEFRILHKYPIRKKMMGVLAAGVRYYQGKTISRQGKADDGYDANFTFLNPENLEGSDFLFPSQNISVFAEKILWLSKKLSISVGGRYEYISSSSEGSYREMVYHPLTNALIFDTTYQVTSTNNRSVVIGGLGFSYRPKMNTELYGNVAQNYRGINFSDIHIQNPNQQVDPDISDEKGFNSDIGFRGQSKKGIFDVSAFFLYYDNKIGVINSKVNDYEYVRLRTNVGKAYSTGIEVYGEKRFAKTDSAKFSLNVFANGSFVYSKYGKHQEAALSENWVELVPPVTVRSGITVHIAKYTAGISGSYVHKHFSDGTNAEFDPNAVAGIIPSYYVLDFSTSYRFTQFFELKAGVNNLTNNKYFTRRASSYPGPGIIPSDAISFYLTLVLKLN